MRLFGPLFAHIKARVLTIEETPLATIEDYVFYGMNNTLEKVNLLRTNLSQVGQLGFGVSYFRIDNFLIQIIFNIYAADIGQDPRIGNRWTCV